MSDEASSTTTWETIVQQYRERAVRDGARIDELRQSTEHWHDTAQMLKRQRNTAEEERDGWKIRAMKAEQGRQVNRDLLIIAEGQRHQAKIDAEHWKAEWAVAVSEAAGVHAECEALRKLAKAECDSNDALRKDAARVDWLESRRLYSVSNLGRVSCVRLYADSRNEVSVIVSLTKPTLREALDAAMAVQPTTGEEA